jgi:hypothetical protein
MQNEKNSWTRALLALSILALVFVPAGCARKEPLTEAKADEIIKAYSFKKEPIYAEVPQRVWWSPASPKDDYDEKALRTLDNLKNAGLVTLTQRQDGVISSVVAKVTEKGFPILGTAPSWRGAVYRGQIADLVYDGFRNFVRHPTEPKTGHAQLVWHYTNPTWLYPLFETKINKPLDKPFASNVSFYWEDYQWKFDVTVRKAEVDVSAPKAPDAAR